MGSVDRISFLFIVLKYFLLHRHYSISHNAGIVKVIISLIDCVTGIPFHSVNPAILTFFHDTHVVACSILVPVNKNNHPRSRRTSPCLPFFLCSGTIPTHPGREKTWARRHFRSARIDLHTMKQSMHTTLHGC